ncbi:MAG: malectin domain-containing carbohydrate-binding protein [Acidobacteriota bacterium]
MASQTTFEEERAALAAVLASGIFQRAPNMARILNYVCAKYFEGEESQLKEYTIAVEALGRPAEFDHERDSIVRVEAYRLRKRLDSFYAGEGAGHSIRIVLPVGQYVPHFVRIQEAPPATIPAIEPAASAETARLRLPARRLRWILGAATLLVLLSGAISLFRTGKKAVQPAPLTIIAPPAVAPSGGELRLLAGWTSTPYTDPFGRLWEADRDFTGGYAMDYSGHLIDGAADPRLYQTSREGDFQYDLPLNPGTYELRLHFAEMIFGGRNVGAGGEGSRIFNVEANGRSLLSRFDIISDAAGANLADERVFRDITPNPQGRLQLRFTHMIRDPLLNALEIKPSPPGRIRPIRIVASEHPFTDQAGNQWEADRYYRGGQLIPRPHAVSGTPDPGLFRHARCGNLTYVIPVAPGSRYSVVLHFAEGWIGTGNPVGGGIGSRLFNIFANEETLARNFDIYREASGAERAIERRFKGLQPNPQGKIVLRFQPVESYACINAIEVIDEGR